MIQDNCSCNSCKDTCQCKVYPFEGVNYTAEEINNLLKSIENKVDRDEVKDGLSAYKVAVANGYQGTEEQWLASLRGAKGDALAYQDLTPEQIAELQKPATDAGDKVEQQTTETLTKVEQETTDAITKVEQETSTFLSETEKKNNELIANSTKKLNSRWRPSVDGNGNLSWSFSDESSAPAPANIKGPQGNSGISGNKDDIDVINDLSGGESTPGNIKVLAAQQGKVLDDKISGLNILSSSFLGQNNNAIIHKFTIIKGHKYGIYINNPWNYIFGGDDGSFTILGVFNNDDSHIYLNVRGDAKEGMRNYYEIIGTKDSEEVQLFIRASSSTFVQFSIIDITNDDALNTPIQLEFKGRDTDAIESFFDVTVGHKYKLVIDKPWKYIYGGDSPTFINLGVYNSDESRTYFQVNGEQDIKNTYEFIAYDNLIKIFVRAAIKDTVKYSLEDITFKEKCIYTENLWGKDNTAIEFFYPSHKGHRYILRLREPWRYLYDGDNDSYVMLGVYNEDESIEYFDVRGYTPGGMKYQYEFTAKDDSRIKIFLRAAKDDWVSYVLEDMTLNSDVYVKNKEIETLIRSFAKKPNTGEDAVDKYPILSIAHISDIHGNKNILQRFIDFTNKIYRQTPNNGGIDIIINTGDTVNVDWNSDFGFYKPIIDGSFAKTYHVIGNHDTSQAPNIKEVYDRFYKPFISYWDFKNGEHTENAMFYFKDFSEYRVRVYFDSDYLKESTYSKIFTQESMDFLINALKTTPEGWGFVYVSHQPPCEFGDIENDFCSPHYCCGSFNWSYRECGDILPELIQAFIDRDSVNKMVSQTSHGEQINVNADFTGCKGLFVCYMNGHLHDDYIGHLKKFPEQINLNINSGNNHYITGSDILIREEGTRSEDCFNLVGIDMNLKTISILRIGAGETNHAQIRKALLLKFDNKNS